MNLDHLTVEEIREQFNRDGVIGPFKVYEPEDAKKMLGSIRAASISSDNAMHKNSVGWDRHFDIKELTNHITHEKIIEKVSAILGNDLLCWRTEFFPKFPGAAGTDWHQVASFQYVTGAPILEPTEGNEQDNVDITVWTAFTDATIENGCMTFIPGSHKKKYYDESLSISKGRDEEYIPIEQQNFYGYDFEEFKTDPNWRPEDEKILSLEMKAGEFVIFTSKCVHGSHPNITERSTRFAFSSRYVPTHVKVYPNHDNFIGHGGQFKLKESNYGTILVSGEDTFKHNSIRDTNNQNVPFKKYEPVNQ